jgi:chromosome segregation ATPase
MATNSDQDDIIAQNERLTIELAAARQNTSDLQAQLESLRAEHEKLKGQLEQVRKEFSSANETISASTKERDDLKAENETLKGKLADFDKAVAAKVAQLGFAEAVTTEAPAQAGETVNYTELCRAARGK